jgi:hypothetical protein
VCELCACAIGLLHLVSHIRGLHAYEACRDGGTANFAHEYTVNDSTSGDTDQEASNGVTIVADDEV